jgi:FlaA1/EpsC-like NDP-sugar epimerase
VRDEDDPDGDIEIVVTGLRPGEKLYEELLIATSNAESTRHPKIMKASEPRLEGEELAGLLARLDVAVASQDAPAARDVLMAVANRSLGGQ